MTFSETNKIASQSMVAVSCWQGLFFSQHFDYMGEQFRLMIWTFNNTFVIFLKLRTIIYLNVAEDSLPL